MQLPGLRSFFHWRSKFTTFTTVNLVNFTAQGDKDTVAILNVILEEEVNHVRIGRVWFEYFCTAHGHDIESYWQALVREYFHGKLKRPFNHDDRYKAGMIRDWYEPLAD